MTACSVHEKWPSVQWGGKPTKLSRSAGHLKTIQFLHPIVQNLFRKAGPFNPLGTAQEFQLWLGENSGGCCHFCWWPIQLEGRRTRLWLSGVCWHWPTAGGKEDQVVAVGCLLALTNSWREGGPGCGFGCLLALTNSWRERGPGCGCRVFAGIDQQLEGRRTRLWLSGVCWHWPTAGGKEDQVVAVGCLLALTNSWRERGPGCGCRVFAGIDQQLEGKRTRLWLSGVCWHWPTAGGKEDQVVAVGCLLALTNSWREGGPGCGCRVFAGIDQQLEGKRTRLWLSGVCWHWPTAGGKEDQVVAVGCLLALTNSWRERGPGCGCRVFAGIVLPCCCSPRPPQQSTLTR